MPRFHIVIEGTDREQMCDFFEAVQNKFALYDNCVIEEISDKDSFIEPEDRCEETGRLTCRRPRRVKQNGNKQTTNRDNDKS